MKYRIWWAVALGVLLMAVGMLGSRAALSAGGGTVAPGMDLVNVTAGASAVSSGSTLTPDDAAAIQAAVQGSKLSWWAKGSGTIGTDTRNTQAEVYAVSGAFQDFHRMDMLYGSFLPRKGAGGRAVVLDSDLAYRLFGTYNAVGLELTYQGETFEVCGVARADDSLLGLMSGSGQFRAYVSGYDLVSEKKLTVAGFEAQVPSGAPGEGVSAIRSAMQAQGVNAGSFLLEDMTEKQKLASETAALPAALLAAVALFVLLAAFIRAFRGAWRETLSDVRGDYFRNVAGAAAWRLGRLLLLLAASAGLVWLVWSLSGLKFFLPTRFIPGSWIDTTFYTGLIQSESQAALAAAAYPRFWWYSAWEAAVRVSNLLSVIACAGMLLASLSLRALWADRRAAAALDPAAKRPGLWDVPALWALCLASYGVYALLLHAAGLPFYTGQSVFFALAIGVSVWVAAMHKERVGRLFFKKVDLNRDAAAQ